MINKFFLVYDKFLPEMHWRKPRVTQSACRPFTKNSQKIYSSFQDNIQGADGPDIPLGTVHYDWCGTKNFLLSSLNCSVTFLKNL